MMQNNKLLINLTKIEEKYIPELIEIEQECFSDPWSYDGFLFELTNPHAVFYLAVHEGKVLGYIGMHNIINEGYIANVAVKQEFRRQGVATFLMENMIKYAKDNKLSFLTLEVRESNISAQEFYYNFGFKRLGVRKNYYSLPTENGLVLTCFLF